MEEDHFLDMKFQICVYCAHTLFKSKQVGTHLFKHTLHKFCTGLYQYLSYLPNKISITWESMLLKIITSEGISY